MFNSQFGQQPPIPQKQTKRQQFRTQIRHRQIQRIKQQIRMRYYQFKQQSDYQLLKSINLPQLIQHCKKHGLYTHDTNHNDNIHCLFLYASSKNSDHLFQLLDQKFIDMLVGGLIVGRECGGDGVEVPVWNREVLWILTNYTAYSQVVNHTYVECLEQIMVALVGGSCQHLYVQQTEQNIVLSISNLLSNSKICRQILTQHPKIVHTMLHNFLHHKIPLACPSPSRPYSKLLYYYSQLLHNLFTTIQYCQLNQQYSEQLIKYITQIFVSSLAMGGGGGVSVSVSGGQEQGSCREGLMFQENKKLVYIMLHGLVKLFGNSVDNQPGIVLKFRKSIRKLAQWFQKFLKTQAQSPKSDTIIVTYIQLLTVVYGPNIDEQSQKQLHKFYTKHFQNHVGKVCTSMFTHTNPLFHWHILKLLQPILLQLLLCQLIIGQYLPILSHIFYHIKNSSYKLKSQALICLINVIKVTSYYQSNCVPDMLQLLIVNDIADILACNLWCFVDGDLNMEILEAVDVLTQGDKNLYGAKLNFWNKFQQAGGIIKMHKILEQSVNAVLKQQVIKILDSVTYLNESKPQ